MNPTIKIQIDFFRRVYPNGEFFRRVKDCRAEGSTVAQAIDTIRKVYEVNRRITSADFRP